jgi:hypothetical protein
MLVLALPGKKLLETVIQPQTTVALNLLIRMKLITLLIIIASQKKFRERYNRAV